MLALADGFLEMERAKARRRGEHHHVGRGDGVLIGVEADKHRILIHFDLFFLRLLKIVEAALQLVLENIGHSNQFDPTAGAEGLVRCLGTAPPAANERQPKGVAGRSAEGEALDWQCSEERAAAAAVEEGLRKVRRLTLPGPVWLI